MKDIAAKGVVAGAAAAAATAQGSQLRSDMKALSKEVNELGDSVANERTAQSDRLKALAGALEEEGRLELMAKKIQTQGEKQLANLTADLREAENRVANATSDRHELAQRLDQLHSEL